MFLLATNSKINIVGLSVINTLIYCFSAIINIVFLKKYTSLKLTKKQAIIPVVLAVFMAVCIVALNRYIMFGNFLTFAILTAFGVFVYFAFIFALKILDFSQIKTMIKNRKKS